MTAIDKILPKGSAGAERPGGRAFPRGASRSANRTGVGLGSRSGPKRRLDAPPGPARAGPVAWRQMWPASSDARSPVSHTMTAVASLNRALGLQCSPRWPGHVRFTTLSEIRPSVRKGRSCAHTLAGFPSGYLRDRSMRVAAGALDWELVGMALPHCGRAAVSRWCCPVGASSDRADGRSGNFTARFESPC